MISELEPLATQEERPTCGECNKVMTQENSQRCPELFLCDACAFRMGFAEPATTKPIDRETRYRLALQTIQNDLTLYLKVIASLGQAPESVIERTIKIITEALKE